MASLGTVIDSFECEASQPGTRVSPALKLIAWYTLNFYLSNEAFRPKLEALLSDAQKRSYCLLWEWWTAAYQDPAFSLAVIIDITSKFEVFGNAEDGMKELLMGHLQLHTWPTGELQTPKVNIPDAKGYHDDMLVLFDWEFDLEYDSKMLEATRQQAVFSAYGQHAAMTCFRMLPRKSMLEMLQETSPHWSQNGGMAFSRKLSYENASSVDNLTPKARRHESVVGYRGLESGPFLKHCKWLDENETLELRHLPHYLWDKKKQTDYFNSGPQGKTGLCCHQSYLGTLEETR